MIVLLTGASGQLGTELIPMLSPLGNLVSVDLDCSGCEAADCRQLDMADGGALETALNRIKPDIIVNAGAFTAVDRAEEEPELAFAVNADAPGRMARWASRHGAFLLHYSTDYVFNGRARGPYTESDTPDPLNTYGDSKLAGERAVAASGARHLVIRTSWVYSAHGRNFVLSMLDLGRRGLELSVVDDQKGCPTWARNLAGVSVRVLRGAAGNPLPAGGLMHYCDADEVSWFGFARLVFETAVSKGRLAQMPKLKPVGSGQYPQRATRPSYSVLDTSLARSHGIVPASLKESLEQCIEELPRD
ncbi:MAG: dTDP-4-dehydrorhamnose reductase [Xanthomonadales bacterium]|nr:dTDP-4-dehydrorhamnose reductase [Xanthomonadales bacterium]